MFVSLPGGKAFVHPAVRLLKEGFSLASVGSLTWTIIGSALTARVSECFMKFAHRMALL